MRITPAGPASQIGKSANAISNTFISCGVPINGACETEFWRRQISASRTDKIAERLEGRHSGLPNGRVKPMANGVQYVARPLQALGLSGRARRGGSGLKGASKLFCYKPFVGHARMQLQTYYAQSRVCQASPHDLKRDHFFGDEEHPFPIVDSARDHVGDCLRLSGARRALNDEIAASTYGLDGKSLRAVRVDNVDKLRRPEPFVDLGVVREQ
jgi:hypothetical protein